MKKTQFVKVLSLIVLIAILFSVISSCASQKVEAPKVKDIKIESTQDGSTTYLVTFEDGSTTTIVSASSEQGGDKITIGENGNFFINGVDTGISSKKAPGPDKPTPKTWKAITVPLYNISPLPYDGNDPHYFDEDKELTSMKVDDISFIIAEGEKEVLYTTLESFASTYKSDLADGVTSKVTQSGSTSVWTLSDKDGKEIYKLTVDFDKKTISSQGFTDDVIKSFDVKNTLSDNVQFFLTEVENAGKAIVYSFADYGLDTVTFEGKTYLPFGLLSIQAQHDIQRRFVYSSKENIMIEYEKDEQWESSFKFGTEYGDAATVKGIMNESMKQYQVGEGIESHIDTPKYMLEYTKNLVLYLMDNYYGLASVLGYKSMVDYINNTVYADKFTSSSSEDRATAYGTLFSLLNDAHTGFTGSSYLDENTGLLGTSYAQTLLGDRVITNRLLNSLRSEELAKAGENPTPQTVRYSKDGKVAYFSFDEFTVGKYYGEETLPDSQKTVDTFAIFVKNFNEIKNYNKAEGAEKGSVEVVIIDDSLNGGGYVAVMGKLLALMSKNNKADLYFKNDNSGLVIKYSYRIDSNNDGAFDEKDCFGQYFQFVIITTPYSFSCGNAFPYYASKMGISSIAGFKSGGGECTVDSVLLPFGQMINHSSNYHIGWYDTETKAFTGDEAGATPQIALAMNLYDLEKVAQRVEEFLKIK